MVAGLSAQLPKITDEQKKWGQNFLSKCAVQSRKTISCLECGHSEKTDLETWKNELTGHTCSACGITTTLRAHTTTYYQEAEYIAVLTTIGGFQVVRTIMVWKSMKRGREAYYYGHEVMQHWIKEDGKVTLMAIGCGSSYHYFDNWSWGSAMEIRENLSNARYRIAPYRVHPKRKVLPIMRRNGFNGHFYGLQPHRVFMALLIDQMSETLIKAGQTALFAWRAKRAFEAHNTLMMGKYWPIIKICIRNNYIIKDATMWEDYIRLLEWFKKDTRNPKYVCPPNLKEAHDRYMRKKEAIQKKQRDEERRKEIEESEVLYREQKKHFIGLKFSDMGLTVKVLETVQEFLEEGEKLKHCVFTNEYYEREHSLILSARIKGKPIETIEVDLNRFEVTQARGLGNKATEHHDRILALVERNMHEIERRASLSIEHQKTA